MGLGRLTPLDSKDPIWSTYLKELVDRAVTIDARVRVLVFGSFAQSRMTEESDLDLAVILPEGLTERSFREKWNQQSLFTKWPFDLVVLERIHFERRKDFGGLCFDIQNEGIELYPQWILK